MSTMGALIYDLSEGYSVTWLTDAFGLSNDYVGKMSAFMQYWQTLIPEFSKTYKFSFALIPSKEPVLISFRFRSVA